MLHGCALIKRGQAHRGGSYRGVRCDERGGKVGNESATRREMVPDTFSLPLSNVLKEHAREDRKAELDMQNDEQDAGETAPDSHLHELPGVSDDGG